MSFSITITGNMIPFNKLMMYKQKVNFIGHLYPKKNPKKNQLEFLQIK